MATDYRVKAIQVLNCINKELAEQGTVGVNVEALLTSILEQLDGTTTTPIVLNSDKFLLRNNGGAIEMSRDNSTWTVVTNPVIPSNIQSFYILNLGENGAASVFASVDLDLNGSTSIMLATEEVYSDKVEQDASTYLAGNISVIPTDGHIVTIGYRY